MIKLLHFLLGRLYFEIHGQNMERFLNLCAKNNLVLWDLKPCDEGYQFFIRKKSRDMLIALSEKTNLELRPVKRSGLPFFLSEHRKRKAFFFSVIFAAIMMFTLSQFIWEITVSGSEIYSESEILKYITANFYKPGTLKQKIDCNRLEEHLREDYDEIAWVSCSVQGTRLHVELKETLDRETKQNPRKPCDIVANKSGIVTGLSVKSGTPLVAVGDSVKKGATLISGLIYYYSDDFQVTETDKIKADGEITMRTKESYKEAIPVEYYEKKATKKKTRIKSLYAGSLQCQIPIEEPDQHMDVVEKKYPLKLGKTFYLPVGAYVRTYQSYRAEKKVQTMSQAEKKLSEKFKKYLRKKKKNGIQVVHHEIEYKKRGNEYVAEGKIIQEEKVGKIRNIRSLTKKQENLIAPTTALPQ